MAVRVAFYYGGADVKQYYSTKRGFIKWHVEMQDVNKEALGIVFRMNVKEEGDNVVGLLSQIGWTERGDTEPTKRIQMEKYFVNVDTNGGNEALDMFHGKMPHRGCVLAKVYDYLQE